MNFGTLRWTTATLLVAIALAACGGSSSSNSSSGSGSGASSAASGASAADNGVSAKSPGQIVAAAQSAAQAAKSVHVSGAVSNGGRQISLDLHLVSGQGGRGSIGLGGANIQLVTIKSTVYLKASSQFWSQVAGNAHAAQILKDRWLKAPATGGVGSFAQFTDLRQLFTQLLSSHGTLAKGTKMTVNGQAVIGVKDSSKGGTLYVATTGQPYPVQVAKQGGGGAVTFDHYNQPVDLTAPAGAVDASQLSK